MEKVKLPAGCESVPEIVLKPKDTHITYEEFETPDTYNIKIEIAILINRLVIDFENNLWAIVELAGNHHE